MGKNISVNVSSKDSLNILAHAKQSATNALKTGSKRTIQKTSEATGDFIGNKIADKTARVSKSYLQNNLLKIKNKHLAKDIYLQKKDKKLLVV